MNYILLSLFLIFCLLSPIWLYMITNISQRLRGMCNSENKIRLNIITIIMLIVESIGVLYFWLIPKYSDNQLDNILLILLWISLIGFSYFVKLIVETFLLIKSYLQNKNSNIKRLVIFLILLILFLTYVFLMFL